MATACCPHCGEVIDTFPDPGGGPSQSYVEDCSVCCKPILFRAQLDEATEEFHVETSREP